MDNQLKTTEDFQVLINKFTRSLVIKLNNKALAEEAAREWLGASVISNTLLKISRMNPKKNMTDRGI